MNAGEARRRAAELVERLRAEQEAAPDGAAGTPAEAPAADLARCDRVTREFVRAMLVWEATEALADGAMARLAAGVVDVNDLRVCMVEEIAGMLGAAYPMARDRAGRLRTALNALYAKEHAVCMDHLCGMSGEDAAQYLRGLTGAPGFVVARVLVRLDLGHAAPVDTRIVARLAEAGVVDAGAEPAAAAEVLEAAVARGQMGRAYRALQAWSDLSPVVVDDRDETVRAPGRRAAKAKAEPRG